jgi:hypothetical protein
VTLAVSDQQHTGSTHAGADSQRALVPICSPSASALQSRTQGQRRFQLDDCSTSEALCGSTHTGPLRAAAHWLGCKSPQRPAADRCGRAWPATGLPAMRREMLPNIIICRRVCACNSIRDASLGLPFGALISSASFGPQCPRRQLGHVQASTRHSVASNVGEGPPMVLQGRRPRPPSLPLLQKRRCLSAPAPRLTAQLFWRVPTLSQIAE